MKGNVIGNVAMLVQEIRLLKMLNHDRNIVQFVGCCIAHGCLLLVQEYMEGGDLREALGRDSDGTLGWWVHPSLAIPFASAFRAAVALHRQGRQLHDRSAKNDSCNDTASEAAAAFVTVSEAAASGKQTAIVSQHCS